MVSGESDLTHNALLRGHNQYVGSSLKVNGAVKRDTYNRNQRIFGLILRENEFAFIISGSPSIAPGLQKLQMKFVISAAESQAFDFAILPSGPDQAVSKHGSDFCRYGVELRYHVFLMITIRVNVGPSSSSWRKVPIQT